METENRNYLTRAQAAKVLQVNPRTVDRYCKDGLLRRVVINGRVRIPEGEIHRMMALHASN